jgi:hypothetical protein
MADALVGAVPKPPPAANYRGLRSRYSSATANGGESGASVATGPRLGPHALEAILCDSIVEVTGLARDGTPLHCGASARTIPGRVRRFVEWRDKGCVADGCTSRYRLQIHHRIHWFEGWTHDPGNLVLLCWFHHHVVIHGLGYRIDPTSHPGRIRFVRPGSAPPSPL